MGRHQPRFAGDTRLLHRQAIRQPLPTEAAELDFHRNMARIAAVQERKAAMLRDPDISLVEVYERQLEGIEQSYRDSIERDAGDDYEAAARAYATGERDDGPATMAAYLLEAVWRIQQMFTVTDMVVIPVVLRYPDCCTVNVRFVRGGMSEKVLWYESPEHADEELSDEHADIYHRESQYSQKQAANRIEATAEVVREQFPDPRETPPEERNLGGIVSAFGRQGSQFCSGLEAVTPDPNRFDDTVTEPTLVAESQIANETEATWLADGAVVL